MNKIFAAGAMLLALTTTANAQEAKHFDGGYLGAEAGIFALNAETSSTGDSTETGVYYGVVAGYRVQTDSDLVLGVEAAFGTSDIGFTFIGDEDDFDLDDVVDHQWQVLGTVGWAFGAEKRDLFSIGAGYAEVKLSPFTNSFTDGSLAAQASYERAVTDNLSLRVKATTYEFDSYVGTAGVSFRF